MNFDRFFQHTLLIFLKNWSPTSEIIWTNGRKLLQCIDSRDDYYKSINDISVNMHERASQDYGLNVSLILRHHVKSKIHYLLFH